MKITDIHVERFGVWKDLSLPLNDSGLTVFYGPNEAGKSTLLRFIRGMLYGFQDSRLSAYPARGVHSAAFTSAEGTLRLEHGGQPYELRRSARPARLSVSPLDEHGVPQPDETDPAERLAELLSRTDSTVFRNVFAVSLHELQELATLEEDKVARHVYDMTLGPDGQRLLDATGNLHQQFARLTGEDSADDGGSGLLPKLLQRHAVLEAEIREADQRAGRHAEHVRQKERLEQQIILLKQRDAGAREQLDGHEFLERVWTPWNQVRESQAELERLPNITQFPENGIERLDELDREVEQLRHRRIELRQQAKQLRRQAAGLKIDRRFRVQAEALIEQQEWAADLERKLADWQSRRDRARQALDERLESLGADWTEERLRTVDAAPAVHFRLIRGSRAYHKCLARRNRLRNRYRRQSQACARRTSALKDRLKRLDGLPVDEAIARTKQHLSDLEDLARLRLQETEYQNRLDSRHEQLTRLQDNLDLPGWANAFMGGMAVMGGLFALLGFISVLQANVLAGIVLALSGLFGIGIAWALKSHFAGAVGQSVEQLDEERRQTEIKLRECRAAISRLTDSTATAASKTTTTSESWDATESEGDGPPCRPLPPDDSQADLIRRTVRQLAELESLAGLQDKVQSRRRRLSELRLKLREGQRDVSAARRQWCELLAEMGLPETVRVDDALNAWQLVAEARQALDEWDQAEREARSHQQTFDAFCRRVEETARRLERDDVDVSQPLGLLEQWGEELEAHRRNGEQQKRLRKQERHCRRKSAKLRPRIQEVGRRRSALLGQGGASSREEFEMRAEWFHNRREFTELLELAEAELDAIRHDQPDLALVEEDLLDYDAEQNRQAIAERRRQLVEIQQQLEDSYEQLGRTKQEIAECERDEQPVRLRFERSQLEAEIRQAAERWTSLGVAQRVLEQMCRRYEKTYQPDTLAAASGYLHDLTRGKYGNVWTRLGTRRLSIDDPSQQSLQVEQLSNGTREQLFLAIRMGLVQNLAEQGVRLPMVLDDVLVNFDVLRTDAAIDTLLKATGQGQQILLFTCHLHLAHMFESRGIEPVWLPSHTPIDTERRAG